MYCEDIQLQVESIIKRIRDTYIKVYLRLWGRQMMRFEGLLVHVILFSIVLQIRGFKRIIDNVADESECIYWRLAFWITSSADGILKQFSYFSQKTGFEISCKFLFFPENRIWLYVYCLYWRQFAWNVNARFLGKIRKISILHSK